MIEWKKITLMILTALLVTLIASGCSEQDDSSITGLHNSTVNGEAPESFEKRPAPSYPQVGQFTASYLEYYDLYNQNFLNLSQGSKLVLPYGALTPPAELYGQDVTISMSAELDEVNNELVFEFGPHGCQFEPPIEVWLNWSDIGNAQPNLYYIDENGNRLQQEPVEVNQGQKKMKLYLDHFSRYALAHG